jgi:type III restriction enzyme
MAIELFQFQQDAASQIADRFTDYSAEPVVIGRRANMREVPFYQALSSITGSGKTAILAQAVSEIVAMSEIRPVQRQGGRSTKLRKSGRRWEVRPPPCGHHCAST